MLSHNNGILISKNYIWLFWQQEQLFNLLQVSGTVLQILLDNAAMPKYHCGVCTVHVYKVA
jgi:hypothetical protein